MPTATVVVFYVSGHGFGHASRTIEVINALHLRRPDVAIHVRTRAARWLFDLTVLAPFTFAEVETDVGVVQLDALTPDIPATLAQANAFYADADARAEREAQALQTAGAAIVVADLPPLAFAAAARAGIRSVGFGNFTWDWIYEDYLRALGTDSDLPARIRAWQAQAHGAWRLPMHGGFAGFTHVRDLPLVARRSRLGREAAREALGWPARRVVVLVSFGGVGLHSLPLDRVAATCDHLVVSTGDPVAGPGIDRPLARTTPAGVLVLDERRLYDHGLRYEDVVAAADVVVTKPGYGIVSECIANRTALLFTSRGRFAEYGTLVEALPGWLRSRFIPREDLVAGRWRDAIESLLALPAPPDTPAVDGAEVAAGWLDAMIPRGD